MLQDLVIGVGGQVETDFLAGRPATCLFRMVGSDGTELVASTSAVPDLVNTTITAAAAARARTITVASASNISTDGRRYLLGTEDVSVKSVSGLTVTLWSPLSVDHASGETFAGARVTYQVAADVCASEFWDAQATFTPASGDPQTEAVNCPRNKIPTNLIGMSDVRNVHPGVLGAVALDLDLPKSFRHARNMAILAIGTKTRAQKHIGVDHFRILASHQWWVDRRPEFGEEWEPQINHSEAQITRILEMIENQGPRSDGAGGATPGTGGAVFPQQDLALR